MHREKILAGLGGGIAIFVTFGLTRLVELGIAADTLLIASMGASAVLLFAIPHGPISQPWNVIGGHVVSAACGVACHRVIGDPVLASAIAAGAAITAMHYLNCLHPPGGATALIPILAGSAGDQFGPMLVLFPIATGAVLMVLLAMLLNWPFPWRRYPLRHWKPQSVQQDIPLATGYPDISHADFVAALAEVDTYVDVSEEDLMRIYHIATRKSREGGGS